MLTHKTKIFNTSIEINYEKEDKDKLIDLINNLNSRIKKFNNLNGKVSDIKIIILTALAIEDELLEKNKISLIKDSLENNLDQSNLQIEKLNSEIINLKDKLNFLELELKKKNHDEFNKEEQIEEITNQLELLNQSILSIYNE